MLPYAFVGVICDCPFKDFSFLFLILNLPLFLFLLALLHRIPIFLLGPHRDPSTLLKHCF